MSKLPNMHAPMAAAGSNGTANAAVMLLLAAYLAIVLYQGNLPDLAKQAKTDFVGDASHPPMWRWLAALLILYGLGRSPSVGPLFAPLFWIAVLAMFVLNAETQPQSWQNLRDGINTFFGASPPGAASMTA